MKATRRVMEALPGTKRSIFPRRPLGNDHAGALLLTAQRCCQAMMGASRPQRPRLLGMRAPAGRPVDLEGGRKAPVRPREALCVDLEGKIGRASCRERVGGQGGARGGEEGGGGGGGRRWREKGAGERGTRAGQST